MSQAPCKDCDRRHYLCHSTCEAYLEFRKKRDEMIALKAEQRALEHIILSGNKRDKKEAWRRMKK